MEKKQDFTEQARKEKNAYLRRWRKANPKKVRQHEVNYWNKRVEQIQQQEQEVCDNV